MEMIVYGDHNIPRLSFNPMIGIKRKRNLVDYNYQDICRKTPLHYIVNANKLDIACMIIPLTNCNLHDMYYRTPLHIAINMELYDMIELLTPNTCIFTIGYDNMTILEYVIKHRSLKILKIFAKHYDLSKPDIYGRTILHYATIYDNMELIEFSIQYVSMTKMSK